MRFTRSLLLATVTFAFGIANVVAEEKGAEAQMKALLEGPWTRLRVVSGLFTDYGTAYAVKIEMRRDKAEAPVRLRTIQSGPATYRELARAEFDALTGALRRSAIEVEAEITKGEVFVEVGALYEAELKKGDQASAETLDKLRKQIPRGGWDVETLWVESDATSGVNSFSNDGHAEALEQLLKAMFGVERRELSDKGIDDLINPTSPRAPKGPTK